MIYTATIRTKATDDIQDILSYHRTDNGWSLIFSEAVVSSRMCVSTFLMTESFFTSQAGVSALTFNPPFPSDSTQRLVPLPSFASAEREKPCGN